MSRVSLAKEPMQLVLKPVGFDKKRFEYEFNAVDDSPPVHRFCARIFVTDYMSPSPTTFAGKLLQGNMKRFYDSGSAQVWPKQGIDIFQIPSELLVVAAVVVAASPAGHRPEEGQCSTGCSSFKEDAFYSMCWQTRAFPDLVVVMTFSHSDCERLEWWTDRSEASGRILMVSPAWFRAYRPRRWKPSNELTLQADANDTMVVLFIPATRIAGICWTGGKMDLAASIANWSNRRHEKLIVTLASHTAELEVHLQRVLLGKL